MDNYRQLVQSTRRNRVGTYLILAWCEGFALVMMALAVWMLWHFRLSLAEVRDQSGTVVGHAPWALFAGLLFAVAYAARRLTRWFRAKLYRTGA
jgi:predicted membrane-bound spermidine synthase